MTARQHIRMKVGAATQHLRRAALIGSALAAVLLSVAPALAYNGESNAAAAQRGVNFLLPDVVNWSRSQGCVACHRQGAALYGLAAAQAAGFALDLSNNGGVGEIAALLAADQNADGAWYWGTPQRGKSSFVFYGLAGYDAFVSTAYSDNIVKGADWALTVRTGGAQSHWTEDFPDGYVMQNDIANSARFMSGVAQAKQRVDSNKAAAYQAALDAAAAYIAANVGNDNVITGVGHNHHAAWALIGMKAAGHSLADNDMTVTNLINLINSRKSNTGNEWGFAAGDPPDPFNTGMVVYAQCKAGVSAVGNASLQHALQYLNDIQGADGSWGDDLRTTFAMLGLSCYGEYGVAATVPGTSSVVIHSNWATTQTVDYTIDIANLGFQPDTYQLTVSGGLQGWTGTLSATEVSVAAGSHQTVTLSVLAPTHQPQALAVEMAVVAKSVAKPALSSSARVTTYTDPPPPTTGNNSAVTITVGAGSSVMIGATQTISATVRDTVANAAVVGPGKGVVSFFVAGLPIGIDEDADGDGVYTVSFSPACGTWTAIGSQDLRAIYTGIDLDDPGVDILSSLKSGAITVTAPSCCPSAEVCDGQDNDCDGNADEDFNIGASCSAGQGACRATGTLQCAGTSASACTAVAGTPSTETCDAIDNDCDGSVDEGFDLGAACSVGVGACETSGTKICGGNGAATCSAVAGTPSTELCDTIDNDCDGQADEGFNLGASCSNGIGACESQGEIVCGGAGDSVCNAVVGSPTTEVCDAIDNDCDNDVDEGFMLGEACSDGVGACLAVGVRSCDGNGGAYCTAIAGSPTLEVCDAIDNNCDGSIDEGFHLDEACTLGVGACQASGVFACGVSGDAICTAVPSSPVAETCDAIDNDCDGDIDNGFAVGSSCTVGVGACAATGAMQCDGNGGAECSATPGAPSEETCDGIDNDCDGDVDEGFSLGTACSVGVGTCEAQGQVQCNATGTTECSATAGQPQARICDGLDHDCDGAIDDGCVVPAGMIPMPPEPAVAGGCGTDVDCPAGQWCDAASRVCKEKLAMRAPMPKDAAHPGGCSQEAALAVCSSGACNAVTSACAAINSEPCEASADCASNTCGADGLCGKVASNSCTADTECRGGACVDGMCAQAGAFASGNGLLACHGAGNANNSEIAVFIALLGLIVFRRKVGLLLTVALGLVSAHAHAETAGLGLDRYVPADAGSRWSTSDSLSFSSEGFSTVEAALASMAWRLDGSYSRDPLVVRTSNQLVAHVVSDQLTSHLSASITPIDNLRLTLSLPLQIYAQGSSSADATQVVRSPAASFAVGDLRVGGTYRVYGDSSDPLRLAVSARLGVPTGVRTAYAGDGSVSASAAFTAAGDVQMFAWSATAAIRWRNSGDATVSGMGIGPDSFINAAAGVQFLEDTLLLGLETTAYAVIAASAPAGRFAVEPALGVHWQFADDWRVHATGGAGLTAAIGSPIARVTLGFEWIPSVKDVGSDAEPMDPAEATQQLGPEITQVEAPPAAEQATALALPETR